MCRLFGLLRAREMCMVFVAMLATCSVTAADGATAVRMVDQCDIFRQGYKDECMHCTGTATLCRPLRCRQESLEQTVALWACAS